MCATNLPVRCAFSKMKFNRLHNLLRICVLAIAMCASMRLVAAEPDSTAVVRSTSNAVTINLGSTRNLDTYLSPIRYQGAHIAIAYEHLRDTRFRPQTWVNQIKTTFSYDNIDNLVGNNTMHFLLVDIDWSMQHRWRNVGVENLDIFLGPGLAFQGGINYNPRNSNNVCSPQVYLNVGATAMAAYRFKVGKLPVTARYQPSIPVVGCYYLPDYDQSFYEIYLGNYRDAVNFGWWANRFDMDNFICADLHLGASALRIGYRNSFTTIWKNNISVNRCVHSFVLGVSWETIRFNPRKGYNEKARIISALY